MVTVSAHTGLGLTDLEKRVGEFCMLGESHIHGCDYEFAIQSCLAQSYQGFGTLNWYSCGVKWHCRLQQLHRMELGVWPRPTLGMGRMMGASPVAGLAGFMMSGRAMVKEGV